MVCRLSIAANLQALLYPEQTRLTYAAVITSMSLSRLGLYVSCHVISVSKNHVFKSALSIPSKV